MGDRVVTIRTDTWDRLRDLQRVYDLDVFGQTAKQIAGRLFEIHGLLSDEQINYLTGKGYRIEVIADAGDIAKARAKEVSGPPSPPKE